MASASIALNRFGLGARPDDRVAGDPKAYLIDQFARYDPRPAGIASAPNSRAMAAALVKYQDERRVIRQQTQAPPAPATPDPTMSGTSAAAAMSADKLAMRDARQVAARAIRANYATAVGARTNVALGSDAPFVERLVQFWSNHFAVSIDKLQVVALAGPMEFEAIRPHVLGRFADMLNAVERHPAMLLYLDQAVSVGPDSPLGLRVAARGQRKVGLNENLAREILELHTLGVRTGYAQGDVTEFARAMTGWTVAGLGRGPRGATTPGDFVFVPAIHQPGDRTILGKRYAAAGEAQAQAVLADLAVHPATATHIATKLTRHFAGDVPPPAMIARLEKAFLDSGGDLPTVYRAIVASPEAWVETPVKFRTPWEWTIAAMRALGTATVQPAAILGLTNQLGQQVWKPGQPIGYDDLAATWAGPDAIMRRVEAAERFATRAPAGTDARALAPKLFPGALSNATAQTLNRAESPGQALALLLVSPEMMRR
ncbi:DUF1800 domain-containing protein [Sphingomonas sp. PB2P19]|uniref:DUF1800 domain-containing protein n=1 Tax=Sphingomonas rhamnosi TaxID=3096156 RepID=UPI002FCC7045